MNMSIAKELRNWCRPHARLTYAHGMTFFYYKALTTYEQEACTRQC
jgi:hypothetical protein